MKKVLLRALAAALVVGVLVGWSDSKAMACPERSGHVNICLDGRIMNFGDIKTPPHAHEPGNLYAPAEHLALWTGVQVRTEIGDDGKDAKVFLNGKNFAPSMEEGARGIHLHDGIVYVPVKEFAVAAGLKLDMDADKGVANFKQ